LYLFQNNLNIWMEGYGGIDNNGAGLMLAMGIPLCIFVWEGTRRWWRWIFAASLPFLLHAVLMTFSRGAMLTLVLTAPLMYLRSRSKGYATVAALCGLAALPFMAGKEIRERFFSIGTYQMDNSAQGRLSSLRAGLSIALENPILGVGPRNANLFTFEHGADRENRTIHNLYLQLAADGGFVASGLYVTALVTFWRGVRRLRRSVGSGDTDDDRRTAAIANGLECAMAVFVTGAMFLAVDVFELPYLMVLLGAQMQLLWAPKMTATASTEAPLGAGAPVGARVRFTPRNKVPVASR
jgi:O-antigen ligase